MSYVESAISVILVIFGILAVEARNLRYSAYLLGIAGILGAALAGLSPHAIEASMVLLVYGVAVPSMMLYVLRKLPPVEREPVGGGTSMALLALIALTVFAAGGTLVRGLTWYQQLAVAMFIVGLYALLVKGNIAKFAVGLAIIDEGLHLCSVFSATEYVGGVVMIQSALCSLITLTVVGMVLYLALLAYQKTGTINSWSLRRLVG